MDRDTPMIYTAPCIMFWMGAYTLRGEVGGGWALEMENFWGHVKWHGADRRVPFVAQKTLSVFFHAPQPCQRKLPYKCFGPQLLVVVLKSSLLRSKEAISESGLLSCTIAEWGVFING